MVNPSIVTTIPDSIVACVNDVEVVVFPVLNCPYVFPPVPYIVSFVIKTLYQFVPHAIISTDVLFGNVISLKDVLCVVSPNPN